MLEVVQKQECPSICELLQCTHADRSLDRRPDELGPGSPPPSRVGQCQAADRARPVISLSGDGGLAMLLGELITVVQHDLPVIPLHQQVIVWAAKQNIELAQPADNAFPYRYVRVK